MKTIKEWFELMPEPYRTRGLKSIDPNFRYFKEEVDSFSEAIVNFCSWENTKEGYDYWDDAFQLSQTWSNG